METSLFGREEEEEEWSNNETGWTKYFESVGSYIKEEDSRSEIVEDDDSLASDASSGPAYFEDSDNRRSKENEVKGHAKCWFDDEVEKDYARQEVEKNKLCKKDRKKVEEKDKRRNFIKL